MYSKLPIRDEPPADVFRPSEVNNQSLAATVLFDGQPLHIWVVHPTSPLSQDGRGKGRGEVLELANAIARRSGPTLVVGDMNRTDGSPIFGEFLRNSGLRDTRLGFGRQPSWPVWSPYRLAIDHAFVGPELAVVDRQLGSSIGSDHLPLVVELAPVAESASTTSTTQRSASSVSP